MRKLLIGLCAALMALAGVPAFANTLTTNYSLNKPTVGADANNWGNLSNTNWDSLDSIIFGLQGTANAACPKVGCTYTGPVTLSAAVTFGLTTVHTGLATFNGGITDNGALSVSGGLSVSGVSGSGYNLYVDGGALGTTSGNAISLDGVHFATTNQDVLRTYASRTANGSDWITAAIVLQQVVDVTLEGYIAFNPAGVAGGLGFGSGSTQDATMSSAGLWTFYNGVTIQGPVAVPAGSIVNAALDTVNGSGGSCGSATTTCALTTNGAGRITSQSSVAISQLPAQSGSAAANLGKVLSTNGSAASWTTTGASAWAYVTTSTAGGSCTVVASYNIAGCSRTTQGNFVFTFTTSMNDANYAPFAMAQCQGVNASCSSYNPLATPLYGAGPINTGFFIHVQCSNCASNTGPIDPDGMYVVVFGN